MGDISEKATLLGRLHSFMLKGATANRRYLAGALDLTIGLLTSTTSPAANTLWAIPFIVPERTIFDTITFRVTTTAVCNARAGIYKDNGCYPGSLIFDTGSIDCSTGAAKDTTITSGLQTFEPGLYWLAWECSAANIQVVCLNTSTDWAILGYTSGLNAASGHSYSVAHTFGALPDPYTAGATILNASPSATAPIIALGLRPI